MFLTDDWDRTLSFESVRSTARQSKREDDAGFVSLSSSFTKGNMALKMQTDMSRVGRMNG